NSGHITQDACITSQFEQQVRMLCGLPAGSPEPLTGGAMLNLLGERWAEGEPDWAAVLAHPAAKLHLYGKGRARPGRKMGHINCLDNDPAEALATAEAIDRLLGRPGTDPHPGGGVRHPPPAGIPRTLPLDRTLLRPVPGVPGPRFARPGTTGGASRWPSAPGGRVPGRGPGSVRHPPG
ncbi:MAG: hypothetical protein ACOC48_04480, partial [Thiohalospira sp.]